MDTDHPSVTWRTSSHTAQGSTCVEVAACADRRLVRDAKDRSGPVLSFTVAEWRNFINTAKACGFDPPDGHAARPCRSLGSNS